MAGKVLMLLDGHSLVYRAFFALPSTFVTRTGHYTNAVYGFTGMLHRLLAQERPSHIAVAFDRPEITFRQAEFQDYKAHREKMPGELLEQFAFVEAILAAWGIRTLDAPGYEADDVIGTIARRGERDGFTTMIVSGDRDAFQLVSPAVQVLLTRKGISEMEIVGVEEIRQRFGVEPVQLVEVKALMGDPSDNIPGIPGIGEKTALRLVQQFGDVEVLFDSLEAVGTEGLRRKLEGRREDALFSRRLARIVTDVPLDFTWDTLVLGEPDRSALLELFRELEFGSLIKRMGLEETGSRIDDPSSTPAPKPVPASTSVDVPAPIPAPPHTLTAAPAPFPTPSQAPGLQPVPSPRQLGFFEDGDRQPEAPAPERGVPTRQEAEALTRKLADLPEVSLFARFRSAATGSSGGTGGRGGDRTDGTGDTRTGDAAPEPYAPESIPGLEGLCFGYRAGDGAAVSCFVPLNDPGRPAGSPAASPLPAGPLGLLAPVLTAAVPRKVMYDAKPVIGLLARAGIKFRGLEFDLALAAYLLNPGRLLPDLRSLVREHLSAELPGSENDPFVFAAASLALRDAMAKALGEQGLEPLFQEVELPLVEVLSSMETAGIGVDQEYLRSLSGELEEKLDGLVREVYALAGEEFNLNSPKQLARILFERLGLPALKKTKTGFSTDFDVLEQLASRHELPAKLVAYRHLAKLKSTYVDALLTLVDPATGRLHTTYNQMVTATGRLSSTEPNLQNIPIRLEEGRRIRKAFVPSDPGWVFLAADYSQIELRILAHYSEDPGLVDAFEKDQDVHRRTAAEVFGLPMDDVTAELRERAKAVNFGIAYGMTDYGLAQQLGVGRSEAAAFIESYFERYAGVRKYIDAAVTRGRMHGYATTILNRRRYLPDLVSRNYNTRLFAERTAINTPIQGSAADIIKIAMVDLHKKLGTSGLVARMLLQVHDELIFETPREELDELRSLVVGSMEKAYPLRVPLKVDVKVGPNLYEMVKITRA
ncbi:MAG: DNA polymerase I [Firmicutes bacterium]|nr:DNA polymerase I [Bacillota bacterium]